MTKSDDGSVNVNVNDGQNDNNDPHDSVSSQQQPRQQQQEQDSLALVDITATLKAAAASLTYQSPMLHKDNGSFSLHDSMAALELMDRKMDGCEVPTPLVLQRNMTGDSSKDTAEMNINGSGNGNSTPKKTAVTSSSNTAGKNSSSNNNNNKFVFVTDQIKDIESYRTVFPRPTPTGLDDVVEPLPWNDLTMEDSAFIAFQNLQLVESLLRGLSVVESTYTNLYAHPPVVRDMISRLQQPSSSTPSSEATTEPPSNPEATTASTIPQHVVCSSTLLMVEFTDLFRNTVFNADIFEEEDFAVNTHNFPMNTSTNREAFALNMASDVKMRLESCTKNTTGNKNATTKNNSKTTQNKKKKNNKKDNSASNKQNGTADHDSSANDDAGYEQMNLAIMDVQLDLYIIVSTLARLTGTEVQQEAVQKQQLVEKTVSKLHDILKMYERFQPIQSDTSILVMQQAFNTYVNRPLIGNAPVRKVLVANPTHSMSNLILIINELDWVVCNTLVKGTTMGRVRRILGRVSSSNVNILSRSLLVLNLYFDDKIFGQHHLPEMIARYMQQLAYTPDVVFNHPAAQAFLNRLCKPMYDTLKVLTLNRNRQRAYLNHMLADFALLRQEAYVVDMAFINDNPDPQKADLHPHFTIFVLSMTIGLMDRYVELGVELELFCTQYDYLVAFWYRDFLLSALLNQMNTMRQMKQQTRERMAAQEQQRIQQERAAAPSKGSKKKGKGKRSSNGSASGGGATSKNVNDLITPTAEDVEDDFDMYIWNMKRVLCRGTVRFLTSLRQAGLSKDKEYEFTSNRKTFEKRFESFATIQQPPPLSYDDFVNGIDFDKINPQDLLSSTEECFTAGKTYVDRISALAQSIDPDFLCVQKEEFRRIGKVCFGNTIYVKKLKQIVIDQSDKDSNTSEGIKPKASVTVDNKTHPQYCTFVVKG